MTTATAARKINLTDSVTSPPTEAELHAQKVRAYCDAFYVEGAQLAARRKKWNWDKLSSARQLALIRIERRIGESMGVPCVTPEAMASWHKNQRPKTTNVIPIHTPASRLNKS